MKDIKGFEGRYAVTSCGKVWSHVRQKFLSPKIDKKGYKIVRLYDATGRSFMKRVARLVLETYRPVEGMEKLQANHIKEFEKSNDSLNNLEWMTPKENANYGTRNQRGARANGIPVRCVETGEVYESISAAARQFGINRNGITRAAMDSKKTCIGYHWEYAVANNKKIL